MHAIAWEIRRLFAGSEAMKTKMIDADAKTVIFKKQ